MIASLEAEVMDKMAQLQLLSEQNSELKVKSSVLQRVVDNTGTQVCGRNLPRLCQFDVPCAYVRRRRE